MARFYGVVGYIETKETKPGVWTEVITERNYQGDVIRDSRTLQNSGNVNDNIIVSNQISVVADAYAYQNFHAIRYVVWNGIKWKASTVDVSTYPRMIMTLGGVYNGE